mmetsp:Transcript_1819/g.3739  ORF Transcript_1819/g.3739 Transcript_1819/m.3739 type:complete len:188 (+) Transcript_1819:1399-1962(+)
MTQAYYENLEVPMQIGTIPMKTTVFLNWPIPVKSLEDRQHLVLGVWGVKKNAQKLRGELQRVLQALPGGLFVPVNEAKSPPHAARFEAPPLNDSVFCLVPKGESPARRGFSTCIMMGSIPIICSDNFIPPYHTVRPLLCYCPLLSPTIPYSPTFPYCAYCVYSDSQHLLPVCLVYGAWGLVYSGAEP